MNVWETFFNKMDNEEKKKKISIEILSKDIIVSCLKTVHPVVLYWLGLLYLLEVIYGADIFLIINI